MIDRGVESWWALTERGIVLLDRFAKPEATIDFCSFASRELEPLTLSPRTRLDGGNPSLSVSGDGRWILYVQFDQWKSDIEMLRGFR